MNELYDNYYEESFSQNKSQQLDLKTFDLVARKFKWNYDRFFSNYNKDAIILDYGCGLGQFIYFLKKEGFKNITGIDISKTQIALALQMQPDVDFVCHDSPTDFLKEREYKYDIIIMNDILEHIEPNLLINTLSVICNSLKENGVVIIKTINSSYPLSHASRYLDLTHKISFHEKSLTQLMRHVGFKDISCYQEEIGVYNILFLVKKIIVTFVRVFIKILIYFTESDWPNIISINLIAIGRK